MEHLAARLHVDCDDTAVVRWADLAQCTLTAVQETSPAATTGGAILRRRMALNHDLDHAFAARNQRHPWPAYDSPTVLQAVADLIVAEHAQPTPDQ